MKASPSRQRRQGARHHQVAATLAVATQETILHRQATARTRGWLLGSFSSALLVRFHEKLSPAQLLAKSSQQASTSGDDDALHRNHEPPLTRI